MSETIQLENESYLVIRNLPEDLANSLRQDFDKMFDLHPKNRGVVITIDPVTKLPVDHLCRRWFQSYLNTPKWDPTQNHNSYMFSGVDPEPQPELPYEFHDVFSYVNNDGKYNQIVANWYQTGSDYIPFHSDYDYNKVPGTGVVIVNLTKSDDVVRTFVVKPKKSMIPDAVSHYIPLSHGKIIEMHGNTQQYYYHGVPVVQKRHRTDADPGPRISLSFRAFQ